MCVLGGRGVETRDRRKLLTLVWPKVSLAMDSFPVAAIRYYHEVVKTRDIHSPTVLEARNP